MAYGHVPERGVGHLIGPMGGIGPNYVEEPNCR
jgi:hypothetical protein